ncbi:MAG: putative antibiotic hydrolase [Phycisphaerales bacterium]|nr:putative antibiotic hydrolase [Phycisphaerales bacterium]
MSVKWMNRRASCTAQTGVRAAAMRAAGGMIERLEPRELLSGTQTTYPIGGANAATWDGSHVHIVAGPDGNLWFADPGDHAIGRLTPNGQVTLFPLSGAGTAGGTAASQSPIDIIVGSDNNLWFTDTGANAIGRITTQGAVTEFSLPSGAGSPIGLAFGPDGKLWFGESGANTLAEISLDGKIDQPYGLLDLNGNTFVDGLVVGPDGNIWFLATAGSNQAVIDTVTPDGVLHSYALNGNSTCLGSGPGGNLWVGNDIGQFSDVRTMGQVGPYVLDGNDPISSIRPGPDGSLYFTTSGNEWSESLVAEISATGQPEPLPDFPPQPSGSGVSLGDFAQSSDGTLWIVNLMSPQILAWNSGQKLHVRPSTVSVVGGSQTSVTVASFSETGGGSDPSDYSVTVTMDDGTLFPNTVTANGAGGFNITVSSDWGVPLGYHSLKVSVADKANASSVTTDAGLYVLLSRSPTGVGLDFVRQAGGDGPASEVARFSGLTEQIDYSYRATIDWGDGQTSVGDVVPLLLIAQNQSVGAYAIMGSHQYAHAGTYTVTTELSNPYSDGLQPTSPGPQIVVSTATVTPPDPNAPTPPGNMNPPATGTTPPPYIPKPGEPGFSVPGTLPYAPPPANIQVVSIVPTAKPVAELRADVVKDRHALSIAHTQRRAELGKLKAALHSDLAARRRPIAPADRTTAQLASMDQVIANDRAAVLTFRRSDLTGVFAAEQKLHADQASLHTAQHLHAAHNK